MYRSSGRLAVVLFVSHEDSSAAGATYSLPAYYHWSVQGGGGGCTLWTDTGMVSSMCTGVVVAYTRRCSCRYGLSVYGGGHEGRSASKSIVQCLPSLSFPTPPQPHALGCSAPTRTSSSCLVGQHRGCYPPPVAYCAPACAGPPAGRGATPRLHLSLAAHRRCPMRIALACAATTLPKCLPSWRCHAPRVRL